MKVPFASIFIAALSTFCSIVLAETLLAVCYPIAYRARLEQIPNHPSLELLHQPSTVPGLSYELAPTRRSSYGGMLIRTNSFGMRDEEPRLGDDSPDIRILSLGDSFTFGFGVLEEDTYPNVLEGLLKRDGLNAEVLNLGVGGYSIHDNLLMLENKALSFQSKTITLGYVLNDPETDPIQPIHLYYQQPKIWQFFHLSRLIALGAKMASIQFYGGGDYIQYLHSDPAKWNLTLAAFERIKALSTLNNFRVLVIVFPWTGPHWRYYQYGDIHKQVSKAANDAGLEVLDLQQMFEAHHPLELMVARNDNHPSRLAHQLTAEAVHRWLQDSGLVRVN